MGVHKPTIRSIPAAAATTHGIAKRMGRPFHSTATPRSINAIPVTRRKRRRPAPGQPWANVENNRRKINSCLALFRLGNLDAIRSPKKSRRVTLSSELEFDDPAFHPDHGGVGAVVGAQFGEDILYSTLDSFFGD